MAMRNTYKIVNDEKARIVARLQKEKIAYWQIAEYFGVHDNTVVRWMRNPTPQIADDINRAIDAIVAAQE
jgi:transposase-like protein